MTQADMIRIARIAIVKRMDYEKLKYSDDLYGRESFVDSVWEFVLEYDQIGKLAFDAKYPMRELEEVDGDLP